MHRFVMAASVAALIASEVNGYPIPPQTLWDLAYNSDVVVLARVEAVRRDPIHDPDLIGFDVGDLATGRAILRMLGPRQSSRKSLDRLSWRRNAAGPRRPASRGALPSNGRYLQRRGAARDGTDSTR